MEGDQADPPPSTEVDLEETVELDEGLELEDWDTREHKREGGFGFASLWATATAQFKHPSVALIIGVAYHLVALLVLAYYFYISTNTKLRYCAEVVRIMNWPLLAGGLTWVMSLCWMIFRLVLTRVRAEPKEIELALIEAEELPDTEHVDLTTPTYSRSPISTRALSALRAVLLAVPYVISVLGLLVVIAGIVVLTYLSVHMALPPLSGTVRAQGLAGPARIEREANGLIHVYAATERDVYFTQGIAMGQERLWQMEIQRRAGSGLLSEVLGNATLDVDIEMRTLGLLRAAQRAAASLRLSHPAVLDRLQAFADGVNWYLDSNPTLPFEFALAGFKPGRYSVDDILTMGKLMALDLGANAGYELDRFESGASEARIEQLWPLYPSTAPTIISNADINQTLDRISRATYYPYTSASASSSSSSSTSESTSRTRSTPAAQRKARTTERSAWRRYRQREGISSWTDASNNWVISGQHTLSGRPILANDPHLGFSAPSIWILMHLHTEDGLNVIGASLPGVPGIVLGRNDHVSWGITNVGADVQDMYVIVPAANPKYYWWQDEMVAINMRTEVIPVKDSKSHELLVESTIYGPIVNTIMDIDGPPMAFRWVGVEDNDTTPVAFYLMNRASTYYEWRDALRLFVAPSSNFVFADTAGNVAYQCTGLIPIRTSGNGEYPVLSNTSAGGLWTGFIPFDELPHVLNPEEGFIVTANNKVIGDDYPYLILNNRDWEEAYRATRIRALIVSTIAKGEKITTAHVQTWQSDQTTVMWLQNLRPILVSLGSAAVSLSTKATQFREQMLAWDGNVNAESLYALPYEDWFFRLAEVTKTELGYATWGRPYFLQNVFTKGDVSCGQLSQCLAFAAAAFEATAQLWASESTAYGDRHTSLFAHVILGDGKTPVGCLWDRSVRVGGDSYTVNPSSIRPSSDSTYVSRHGASYREVVDLGNPEASQFIHPMGQSGSPFSSHYDDYLPMWASGVYIPMRTAHYSAAETFNLEAELPRANTATTAASTTTAASIATTFTAANAATAAAASTGGEQRTSV